MRGLFCLGYCVFKSMLLYLDLHHYNKCLVNKNPAIQRDFFNDYSNMSILF
jgi:hypothetical protein